MSSFSGSKKGMGMRTILGIVAMLTLLLAGGLAQAKAVTIDTGANGYTITYSAKGVAVNPSGLVSFRGIAFNPSSAAAGVTFAGDPLVIQVNGLSADSLTIAKKKGVTAFTPIASLESNGGFAKLTLGADVGSIRAAGNIGALSSKANSAADVIAMGFGSVKMTSLAGLASTTLDTWDTVAAPATKPLAGKIALSGVALSDAFLSNQNAAIKVAAKKTKAGIVAASVLPGAQILGQNVSVAVTGGDMLAMFVQAEGAIKAISSKAANGAGGVVGQALTPADMALFLDATTAASVVNPSSIIASGVVTPANPEGEIEVGGIGTVSGSTEVNGVFVAGATETGGLLTPNLEFLIKKFATPVLVGDSFTEDPQKSFGKTNHTNFVEHAPVEVEEPEV